jgi:ABC-2 type transport system permease protein
MSVVDPITNPPTNIAPNVPVASQAAAPGGDFLRTSMALVRRNILSIMRLPSALVPSLIFPIFGTIAFSSLYGAAIRQYYPHLNALNWFVPINVMQGAAFSGVFLSFAAIRDFETGIIDRLLAAPLHRRSLLAASIFTAAARALLPFVLVMIIGLVGGMTIPGGVAGVACLLIATIGTAVLGSMWGMGLAYRFKSMAAAPLMQMGVFVLVFLSATQVPMRGLSGWLHRIARVNPATNILRLGRQGFLGHVTWHDTWPGLLAVAGLGALLTLFADRGLQKLTP